MARLGHDTAMVDTLPDRAVESFAGVGNPFQLRTLEGGEHVVDVGSGGFRFVHRCPSGGTGWARRRDRHDLRDAQEVSETADQLGLDHVEFREGLAETLPVDDAWADVVIANGVINLCPDKKLVFSEIHRVLRPGGWLQFADIANGRPVPPEALRDIDLWTG